MFFKNSGSIPSYPAAVRDFILLRTLQTLNDSKLSFASPVLHSVHTAADNKEVTLLIGLDLFAAFDTVCHSTLTQRLHTEFGVSGTALSWIQSNLQDRTLFMKIGQHRSSKTNFENILFGSSSNVAA